MNKFYLIISILCLFTISVSAQTQNIEDVVYLKNGSIIRGIIIEQVPEKTLKIQTSDGDIFVYNVDEVEKITKEDKSSIVNQSYSNNLPEGIKPNMIYNDYDKMYKAKTYVPQVGDPYSPSLCGLASFFIPGLGEMIAGEVGNGALDLLCTYGLEFLGTVAMMDTEGRYYFEGCLFLGLSTYSWISSIIDAVKTAKIKNMYIRDMKNLSNIDIKLAPYAQTISLGNKRVTPVGLSLNVSF